MTYSNPTGFHSVTDAIKRFVESEWIAQEYLDRGTAVHDAAHTYLMGDYVVPIRSDWRGYFESFKRWADANEPIVEAAETRWTDETLKFTGQIDFVGRVKSRPGRGLIDFKTAIAASKWHRLQGAAYRHLAGKNGLPVNWGGNLRLRPDGKMPLFDPWPDNSAADFSRFLCALTLQRFFNS